MVAQVFDVFFALSDPAVFIDIVLTALIVGFVGAIVYVFLIDSMKTDRGEARRKMIEKSSKAETGFGMDLWGTLSGNNSESETKEEEQSPKSKASKIVIIALAILIVAVFIIKVVAF